MYFKRKKFRIPKHRLEATLLMLVVRLFLTYNVICSCDCHTYKTII